MQFLLGSDRHDHGLDSREIAPRQSLTVHQVEQQIAQAIMRIDHSSASRRATNNPRLSAYDGARQGQESRTGKLELSVAQDCRCPLSVEELAPFNPSFAETLSQGQKQFGDDFMQLGPRDDRKLPLTVDRKVAHFFTAGRQPVAIEVEPLGFEVVGSAVGCP